jgi:hypothetical protein
MINQPSKLFGLREYRALDEKRRQVARAMLLSDRSLTRACRDARLNASREKRNVDLQKCLWAFNQPGNRDAQPVEELSIYERADRLEKELAADPEKRAAWDAQFAKPAPAPPTPAPIAPTLPAEIELAPPAPVAVVPNDVIAVHRGGQCRSCGASTPEGWMTICTTCSEALGWG